MRISIIITVIMIGQPPNGYVQTNEDVKATNLGMANTEAYKIMGRHGILSKSDLSVYDRI